MDQFPPQQVLIQVYHSHVLRFNAKCCFQKSFLFVLFFADVMVEKFGETDSNLFLEKLCFEYAAELSREACLSPCSLVVALIYLDRLCQTNPNFVSSIPSSKLFLISVVRTFSFSFQQIDQCYIFTYFHFIQMVASKFLNDEGEEDEVINSEWANSAKIDLTDLNQIERQFLQAIVSSFFHLTTVFLPN